MRAFLAVALGGLIGTALRLGVDLAYPHDDGAFPTATLLVNGIGALVLGWLVGGLWTRPTTPTWLRAGLGSGVIGSFTTLSAVMVSLLLLTREQEPWLAGAYLAASVVGGLALAAAGLRIGSRLAHRSVPTEVTDAGQTL